MKKILLILTILLVNIGYAHPIINNDIANALKSGNAAEVAKYFSNSVDLTLPSNEGVYSKTQAELILKTFFSNHQPKNFNIVHNGDSKNNTHFSIGNLVTENGTFRTYILYKEKDNNVIILELRIETDD